VDRVALTIGHSTRTLDELVSILRDAGATLVVDVRTVPRSRRNPQFDRDTLPGTLGAAGIAYRHEPALGGLRRPRADSRNTAWTNASFRGFADHMETEAFEAAIETVAGLAGEGRPALMCAEAVPWRCHRSLLADALLVRGIEVRHLLGLGRSAAHALTPFARVDGARVAYPGLL
jgi:uncharacterized protein (DUF488 family)